MLPEVVGASIGGTWGGDPWSGTTNPNREQVGDPISRFVAVASDLYPVDILHLRRALVGGQMSRSWLSWTTDGLRYVISIRHNGSGADPRNWVTDVQNVPAGRYAEIDLGGVARSAAYIAGQVAGALDTFGVANTVNGSAVDWPGVNRLTGGVMTPDTALRGMWGFQRDFLGATAQNLRYTPAGGTLMQHLESPGATLSRTGRALGLDIQGRPNGADDFEPLLALGRGPAYSANPGEIEILGEFLVAAPAVEGDRSIIVFPEPLAIGSTDELWVMWRSSTGDVGFRNFADAPVAVGNFDTAERLVVDDSISNPATSFGSAYTPTVSALLSSVTPAGIIFELEDAGGAYPNGNIDTWIGDQNTDPAHGTQGSAGPGIIDQEGLHFRRGAPQWTDTRVTQVRFAIGALGVNEDIGTSWYQWTTLDAPSTTAPTLIADTGAFGLTTANAYNTMTLGTPVEIGTEALGANAVISFGVNFGLIGGGAIVTLTAIFFAENGQGAGENGHTDKWVDERGTWDDFTPAGGGGLGSTAGAATEYRTRGSVGSTMPNRDPDAAWPEEFEVDNTGGAGNTDDELSNSPLMAWRAVRETFAFAAAA